MGGPDQSGHPTADIDDVVHQRHRLGILTITAETKRVEFGYLREVLALTAGNLSRHITVLEEAGLVAVQKGYDGRRPRTWVRISDTGRAALAREMAALRALVNRQDAAPTAPATSAAPDGPVAPDDSAESVAESADEAG